VRADVVARWIDDACRAYLRQCAVLESTRAEHGLELVWSHDGVARVRPGDAVVSASASEIWPTAFAISVRIRTDDERPMNVVCRVRLSDAERDHPIGDDIRDELIALEHAAQHFN
jgi:hypothetical protein